jgi:peptide/nickel transport system substrate-binding protein
MEPEYADGVEGNDLSDCETCGKFSREEMLRRTLAAGVLVGTGGLVGAERALARSAPAKAKRGGTLRHGGTASFGAQTLDAHKLFGFVNDARTNNLYEKLVEWDRDHKVLHPYLAEEFTQEKPDQWLIRIRPGIEWHNGKTLTIDDVIYTFQRIIDPKTAAVSASTLASVDPKGFTKLDNRTVRLKLKRPDVSIAEAMGEFSASIVPVGYDPANPVGTGPFKYKSYTPGVQTDFLANRNFWQSGLPYVDELIIFDFPDESARVNALLSGQVDVIDHVPLGQVSVIRARNDVAIFNEGGNGQWLPFTMRVDLPPFKSNDVRQAMRLIANRPQMVKQALAGFGRVGNDIFSPLDPCYNSGLPQRHQDIERAKFLLKRAGRSKLKVQLIASNPAGGMLEAAQVLAENARAAGVTINVKNVDVPTLFGPQYVKWLFAMNFWGTRNFLLQAAQDMLPNSAENNTHWPDPQDRSYPSLYRQALGTVNRAKRCQIIHQMQRMEWERGGHLVWGFSDFVDGYNKKVQGLLPNKGTMPLNAFRFKLLWFA